MTILHFAIETPDGQARVCACSLDRPIWIGRDASCDIVLDAEQVSRKHACIEEAQGLVHLRDRSVNGTEIDGRCVRERAEVLALPAELRIGGYRLRVRGPRSRSESLAALPAPSPRASSPSHDARDRDLELRRRIRRSLLDHLDLARFSPSRLDVAAMRPKVVAALETICAQLAAHRSPHERAAWIAELTDEALGLGPLTGLLEDDSVSEIMVVDPQTIYVERAGLIEKTAHRFTEDDSVRIAIERIVTPIRRRIDESCPLVDARLPDGSRVNAIIPPLAVRGPCITIRKLRKTPLQLSDLVRSGTLSAAMAAFLRASVRGRRNIVIAGGTGSGKTTLLNVLSAAIPARERIVTIEDAVELQLQQEHVVALEAKLANIEGRGAFTIRELLKNALRMRPDRIVVGECRGGEAIDMLQAMNTGHEGSMTTTHANSPREACARLETLCLMAGLDLPIQACRRQIATSVHLLVQQARLASGARRVTSITEVVGLDERGEVELRELFRFEPASAGDSSEGSFVATGHLPSFTDVLEREDDGP